MSNVNYTRASISTIEGLTLEVNVGRENILSVGRFDGAWNILMHSANPNNPQPVQISWQEFLEIVHEIQKFVAIENEILIAGEDKAE